MRTRIRLGLMVGIWVLSLTVQADQPAPVAAASKPTVPTSARAVEARRKFDDALHNAQKSADDAAALARTQYVADLERALSLAMSTAAIADANWARAELALAKKGDFETREIPKLKIAAETRGRFDRAIDKAYVDQRPRVEAARKQYIAELDACKRQALSQSKDLDEANRIAAEIPLASMRDITSNEWVNLLAASHAADWDQDKDPRARKMTMQPDGSILVTGYTYYGRDFADARIHARVRKTGGQNLVLALRVSAAGQYAAWSNGDTSFGIGVNREGRWTELAGGVSKPYTGLAEVEFSAVGQELTLRVGGDVVVKVNDASFARGRAGIGALGQGQMADLRLRVLDGLKIPPPTTQP